MSSAAAKVPGEQPELFETPAETPEAPEVVKVEAKDDPPAPPVDDGVEALKAQLEDLRQRERQAREQSVRWQAESVRKAQDQQVQLSQSQYQTAESHLLAVSNAIVAAQSEADRAQADLVASGQMGDFAAMGDAQRRLARSEARLEQLENGKADLETRVQQHKAWAEQQARYMQQLQQQPQQQPEQQGDQLDRTNLPQRAKEWLRGHSDYLTDPRKNAKLQSLHWDVKEETGEEFTDRYYTRMEELLGMRQPPRQDRQDDDTRDERTIPVSAPVSRDPPSSGGSQTPTRLSQVRLTGAQREAAKLSGITESEYAKNLLRMMKEKTDGLIQ